MPRSDLSPSVIADTLEDGNVVRRERTGSMTRNLATDDRRHGAGAQSRRLRAIMRKYTNWAMEPRAAAT